MSVPWLVDESYSSSLSMLMTSDNDDMSLYSSSLSMLVPSFETCESSTSTTSLSGDVLVPASIAAWGSRRYVQ